MHNITGNGLKDKLAGLLSVLQNPDNNSNNPENNPRPGQSTNNPINGPVLEDY